MRILIVDTIHPYLKNQLIGKNHICDTAYKNNKSDIEKIIHNYEGIIIRSKFSIDKDFINKATKLKFIARAGVGLENINTTYAESRNIKCFNGGDGNSQAVAEHALAMLLSLLNNINSADKEIRKGKWNRESNRGIELFTKKIAIIGFGNTGSAFAKVLKGFNVNILAYDKYLKNYSFKSSMEKIYKEADVVSLHIPLNKENTYLVDNVFFNKFKKSIYLINTSRGKCVKTKDLVTALKKGKVKGVGLDVLEYENKSFESLSIKGMPKDMLYLLNSNKTILSPHIAGWTEESNIKIANILLNQINSMDK